MLHSAFDQWSYLYFSEKWCLSKCILRIFYIRAVFLECGFENGKESFEFCNNFYWAKLAKILCIHCCDFFMILNYSVDDYETQHKGRYHTDQIAVKQNFRKIIREWLWGQKHSFYVFAKNYIINKWIILKMCMWTYYWLWNNTK